MRCKACGRDTSSSVTWRGVGPFHFACLPAKLRVEILRHFGVSAGSA